jgi:hypothetical protein
MNRTFLVAKRSGNRPPEIDGSVNEEVICDYTYRLENGSGPKALFIKN